MKNMSRMMLYLSMAGLVFVVVAGGGCKKKQPPIQPEIAPASTSTAPETGSGSGQALPDIDPSNLRFERATDLDTVYFDYDSYSIRPDAAEALRRNAERMLSQPGQYYQLAGHCDERGTQEYNLALGERRALAVRDYLMQLGVSGDRLLTISYGEEDPVDPGHNKAAWAKNRRVEFHRAL